MEESAVRSFQRLLVTPRESKGVATMGSVGFWIIPFPPKDAPYDQVIAHAAVMAYLAHLEPLRDTAIGISAEADRTAKTYLERWHGDAGEYFRPFSFGE